MNATSQNSKLTANTIGKILSVIIHLGIFIPFAKLNKMHFHTGDNKSSKHNSIQINLSKRVEVSRQKIRKKKVIRKIRNAEKISPKVSQNELNSEQSEQVIPLNEQMNYSPVYSPKPRYPKRALRKGWEGVVKVKVTIKPNGIPENVDLLLSSGHDILDKEAIKTLYKWRFPEASSTRTTEKRLVFKRL